MPPSASRERSERRAGLAVVCAFALSTILFRGAFPPFANPNELSRLETVFAFVEQGTFRIDGAIRALGDHEDKAVSGGHFYSNKAPGLALASIPVYRLLRSVFPPPRSAVDPVFYWLRLLTVSSVCVLAAARFHSRLVREGAPAASLVLAAAVFGTPYLFYARSFFSHAWTAALLFLSWDLLKLCEDWRFNRRVDLVSVGAGFAAGLAAISEYPVALIALLILARAGAGRSFRKASLFAAGMAVPAGMLLFYNAACFGSPLVLASSLEALPQYAELAHRGLFGIGLPRMDVALAFLFHPARGLLLFSPFLLWTAFGLVKWRDPKQNRADGALCLCATVLFFVLLCGYSNWHGGWSLGNRYLLPPLFFAALAAARGLEPQTSRWLFAVAASFSIGAHLLLTSTFPHFPPSVDWPPATGSAWFLERGWIAPSVLPARGLDSAGALACVLAGLAATAAALSAAQLRGRPWIPMLAGVAILALTLRIAPALSFGPRLWRAAVFGRYSGRDPDRQELRRAMSLAVSPSEKRFARNIWALYGTPPPRQ